MIPTVGFAGSRSLPAEWFPVVNRCVGSTLKAGRRVVTGCAQGLDNMVLDCFQHACPGLQVFVIGNESGEGFWKQSAPFQTLTRLAGSVVWEAGGPVRLVLPARLRDRTKAMVRSIPVVPGSALVCFFRITESRGTLLAARTANSKSLPVIAFSPSGIALPRLSNSGQWQPIECDPGSCWSGASRWVEVRSEIKP